MPVLHSPCSCLYPFLAVSAPLPADALVVEGWLPDENIKAAIAEFQNRSYQWLITTGGPIPTGFYLSEYKNFADLSAATFLALGFEPEKLIVVPADYTLKDRTYMAAVALRQWIDRSDYPIQAVNVFTAGVHARRSWLLYRKALEPAVRVGILSTAHLEYDAKQWWTSSVGVRTILSELIAYVYACLFDVLE